MGFNRSTPVVAGTVLIRSDIRSQNYVPGSSGWIVEADGDAEFNSVTVRGNLVATGNNNAYIEMASQPTPEIVFQPPDYVPGPPYHSEIEPGAIYVYNNGDVREIMLIQAPHFNTTGGAASALYPQIYLTSPRYDGSAGPEVYVNDSASSGAVKVSVEGSLLVGPGTPRDIGRGYVGSDRRTSSSGAVGPAEAVAWTLSSRTFKAGRAYEARINLGLSNSVAGNFVEARLKKTNAAGQLIGELYRTAAPTASAVYGNATLATFVVGANDVTASLVITLESAGGTNVIFGSASASGSVVKFYDVGAAADFYADDANIPILV